MHLLGDERQVGDSFLHHNPVYGRQQLQTVGSFEALD